MVCRYEVAIKRIACVLKDLTGVILDEITVQRQAESRNERFLALVLGLT